ncbi:MAG: hypothetical protein P4L53_15280 [Candidatus Obscuribacterales bacterium]|nr:hypothetical protein [Candidatus Obscuribacterales bacterium]
MGNEAYGDTECGNLIEDSNEKIDLSFVYRFQWGLTRNKLQAALREALKELAIDELVETEVALETKEGRKVFAKTGLKNSGKTSDESIDKEKRASVAEEAAKIRWLLAINPNTPAPILEHLAKDQHIGLLERIAEHPRTHVTTLLRLSAHEDAQVRAACTENNNLSIKTIWRLARDNSADVRLRMAESYTVPLAVLRVLCEDENPYVAHRAAKTIQKLLEQVNSSRSA